MRDERIRKVSEKYNEYVMLSYEQVAYVYLEMKTRNRSTPWKRTKIIKEKFMHENS